MQYKTLKHLVNAKCFFIHFFSMKGGVYMLDKARRLASEEFSRLSGREIKAKDCYVVWFSKVLQNWKVLVGTDEISSDEPCGNYAEITHNGDKNETYVDVYSKVSNKVFK